MAWWNLAFLSSHFPAWSKKLREKIKNLKNEKSFQSEIKWFFFHFQMTFIEANQTKFLENLESCFKTITENILIYPTLINIKIILLVIKDFNYSLLIIDLVEICSRKIVWWKRTLEVVKYEHISERDYEHAVKVWNKFGMENMGDYPELYLKTNDLLLVNVFEDSRKMCLQCMQ